MTLSRFDRLSAGLLAGTLFFLSAAANAMDDNALGDILDKVYAAHEGKKIDVKALAAAKGLKEEFAKIVEDFDRDRVHDNDVKKLFTWYNILIDNGFTKFAEIEEEKEAEKSDAPAEEE